ncbi:MAG TPA: SDR family oxidoreductase [Streptosporangiaceae bacterium]|jgi:NAD(P)-dependent dehydrogenase (short-subunit alcohol dehydrogenase family)|nr:SDR family oxidoreductase [Streptosporangiaceae bacterium]
MADRKSLVVIGGTSGLGLEIARRAVARGEVVTISGRDAARASAVAAELGGDATGIAVNIADPMQITRSLADVGEVDHLVLSAIERDQNTVADYDVTRAIYLSTLKLVGYIEVVHALHSRLTPTGSIVLFGGLAKERPYPGSTTVSTINGGVTGMVKTLAVEMAPVRVNAIHPGIVGDTWYWARQPAEVLDRVRARTPTGDLPTTADVADAVEFLLRNRSVNGVDLYVDSGWILT